MMVKHRLSDLVKQNKTDQEIYHELMQFRVREILLVATIYDAFILEEEDKLTEKIFGEYYQLNLTTAPRISSVSSGEEAVDILRRRSFDMVILTMRIDEISPFELARRLKEMSPGIPILLLLNDNTEIALVAERREKLQYLDKVFVWNGDAKIFLAMIKYIEDKINVVRDTKIGLVRVILLVEDSSRYISSYLPTLYIEIMKQTQRIIADEHLDEMRKLLRMRARPKVLMAESFEEAVEIFEEYKDYLLCLICDVKFPKSGRRDEEAGLKLIRYIKGQFPDLPTLLQSAEPENRAKAESLGCSFIDKNSESLSRDLTSFVFNFLGFGDFIFRDWEGNPIGRAQSLEDFKQVLVTVPDESLVYHANRNHFSGWLMARGEIRIAKSLQPVRVSDFPSYAALRSHLIEVFRNVQESKLRGRVVQFDESLLNGQDYAVRLSEGSLGGKGRGMAFLHMLIQNCQLDRLIPEVDIRIPHTAMIGTEEYDGFIERNGLSDLFVDEQDYERVKRRFLRGRLSEPLREKLAVYLSHVRFPLSIRSSALFEDSLSQPFSGIYDTFLLPNNDPDPLLRQRQLEQAIKLVYASVFSRSARAYFDAIGYKIGEEKMAVLIQAVVGREHQGYYYPHFSGVAQSYNYYPVSYLKPEDGIAVIAVGLGRYVIDGEKAYRFCPHYPKLEFEPPEDQLKNTQQNFYALRMGGPQVQLASGDHITLERLAIDDAGSDGSLQHCVSVWDYQNNRLQVGNALKGPKVVNFAYILKYDYFPLARVLEEVLDIVKTAMGTPVEVEFAVDLSAGPDGRPIFYILQMKPLLGNLEDYHLDLDKVRREELLLYTDRAMGNGTVNDLHDIIYVDPDRFDRSRTVKMIEELDELNGTLKKEGRRYILIGPGRWGSRDPWLGVPVNWSHISNARIIVEVELADFKVDPSLGSHFFHNVTSMNIGYFDVPYGSTATFIDWSWLKSMEPLRRTRSFVHVRSSGAFLTKMDGRRSVSIICKPAR